MITFSCTHCNKPLHIDDDQAGKRLECSSCGMLLTAPAAGSGLALSASKSGRHTGLPGAASASDSASALPGGPEAPTVAPDISSSGTHCDGVSSGAAVREGDTDDNQAELISFLAPPQAADELGRLGIYRVQAILGRGGMGVVFRAQDPHLERLVALKAMLPSLASNKSAKERFFREAKAAAALKHPHVVTIHQVGEDRGAPYLAMEYLEGESLDDRLRREGRLPALDIVRIGMEMAEGLEAAHESGLIHRDVKPGNVWLEGKKGHVKVLDFGLARGMADQTQLTQAGAIVGTPAYMAPEQASGRNIDRRCDLFSLGCVLYRMCTGELPFKGQDTIAIIAALALDNPPPPASLNPELPVELSDLVMQLLAKDPSARPPHCRAVVEALQALMLHPARSRTGVGPRTASLATSKSTAASRIEPAAPVKPRGRRSWVILAVCLLGLVGTGWAGSWLLSPNRDNNGPPSTPSTQIAAAKIEPITRDASTATSEPAAKNEPIAVDPAKEPDRRAAEYVLSIGGSVRVSKRERAVKSVAELPRDYFALTGVILENNNRIDDAGLAAFKGCTHLTELNLGNTQVGDGGLAAFRDCKQLTVLNLRHTELTDAGLALFKECKKLRELDLRHTRVSDAGLSHVKNCKDLNILVLSNTRVSDAGLVQFKGCNLTELGLFYTQVTDAGLANFDGCKNLTELDLRQTQVGDAGVANFKNCKDLTVLALGNTKVTDAGLACFRDCKMLKELNLFGAPVTDAGLAYFKDCPNLEELDLGRTRATNAGLAWFKGCKKLTELQLSGTQVTDSGLVQFANCKQLVRIRLTDTKVTAAGISELKKALPSCQFERGKGSGDPKKRPGPKN